MRSFSKPRLIVRLLVVGIVAAVAVLALAGGAFATNGKVLILDPTVSGGAASLEAAAAVAAGHGVDVVDAATWGAMTQANFAAYDAIILGDPTCVGSTSPAAAAELNRAVWSPAVNGNVIIIGTDPVFHAINGNNAAGAATLITNGVKFAADQAGSTGLYVSLSCYYYSAGLATSVPVLDQLSPFGTFTLHGQNVFSSCPANSHIVASHPAFVGLADSDISNWSCSAHEAFENIPADFAVLAINTDIGGTFVAPDGTVGGPYILARGTGLIFPAIVLTPRSGLNPVGTSHTVTATVSEGGVLKDGVTVTFTVVSGPDAGVTGTAVTNADGVATFTYVSAGGQGTDVITASYVDSAGRTETSNRALKRWFGPPTVFVSDVTVRATLTSGTPVTFAASALDELDGVIPATCTPPSGSSFPLGLSPVTCSATDSHGLTGSASFHVLVRIAIVDSWPSDPTPVQDAPVSFSVMPKAVVYCSLDSGPERAKCPSPLTFHGLAPGLHTFCVRGVARGGVTETRDCRSWTYGPSAPHTTITSATLVGGSDLMVTFASDQPGPRVGSGFMCNLDFAGPWRTCSSGLVFHGLAGTPANPAVHCIYVQATNVFGITDPSFASVYVVTPGGPVYIGGCGGGAT